VLILALDLGLQTGFALHDGIDVDRSGVRYLPADHSAAVKSLHEWLRTVVRKNAVDLIAFEDVPAQAHSGGIAAHLWGAWYGIVLLAARQTGTRYLGVNPATWKRAAELGSGTGEADALRAARARWPRVPFETADEAVARFVAVAACAKVARSHP